MTEWTCSKEEEQKLSFVFILPYALLSCCLCQRRQTQHIQLSNTFALTNLFLTHIYLVFGIGRFFPLQVETSVYVCVTFSKKKRYQKDNSFVYSRRHWVGCHSIWMTESKRVHTFSVLHCWDTGIKVNIINMMISMRKRVPNTSSQIPLEYFFGDFSPDSNELEIVNLESRLKKLCAFHTHFAGIKRTQTDFVSQYFQEFWAKFIHSAQLHCVFYSMTRKISNYTWFYGQWFLTSWYFDIFIQNIVPHCWFYTQKSDKLNKLQ